MEDIPIFSLLSLGILEYLCHHQLNAAREWCQLLTGDDNEKESFELIGVFDKLAEFFNSASKLSDYDFQTKATEIITPLKTE